MDDQRIQELDALVHDLVRSHNTLLQTWRELIESNNRMQAAHERTLRAIQETQRQMDPDADADWRRSLQPDNDDEN